MNYFVLSLLVALGSILVPTVIAAFISNYERTRTIAIGIVASAVYCLLHWWIFWGCQIGTYGPTPLAPSIIIGAIISIIISSASEGDGRAAIPGTAIAGGYLIVVSIVGFFGSSDMMNSSEKARLIGNVKEIDELSEVLQPQDPAHICQVSQTMANISVHNALSQFVVEGGAIAGSRYEIGNATKVFVDGHFWFVYELDFPGWLKWRQDKQVPGYLRVSAENPKEPAQPVQTNKQGQEIHIRYLNSACFEFQAERYLREHGYMDVILDDWTFEPDDNWNPYYTVSVMERTIGFSGMKVVNVLAFNLQTGVVTPYTLDNLPTWIDRARPLDVIKYNAKKWGEYALSDWWYTVKHDDKSQKPTQGWFLTYDSANGCHWFTGFTSKNNSDDALTGFLISSARKDTSVFYKVSGVTEDLAYQSAKSLWNNFKDYQPTELVPYNIYGKLTYVIPMEYRGQFVGISLISLDNKIKGKGTTLDVALGEYRAAMELAGGTELAPNGGAAKTLQITAKVDRVGSVLQMGDQQIFSFMLEGVPKEFQVTYSSYAHPEVVFLAKGMLVTLTYDDSKERVIQCKTFGLPEIVLTDESPVQARYVENLETAGTEINRVSKNQELGHLLNSSALQNVDPDSLKAFLDRQKENK